ncbi:MAG: prolyl oligopeptidase family serine peptidase [Anaerolineaceae bacterium]|nr:prolyl oligopeptidase family serine peptidase [Anaerolineaceae bacterium]
MSKLIRGFVIIFLVASILPFSTAQALTLPDGCTESTLGSSQIMVCKPTNGIPLNGDAVIFAHGYVNPNEPVGIPEEQLLIPGSQTSLSTMLTKMGYVFATTSYRKNGLAVKEGIEDILILASFLNSQESKPRRIFLTGASEGGLITALALENHPDVFIGGFSACGPVGDFRKQVNYWGDFRVVFDFLFPGMLAGSPVSIPDSLIADWQGSVKPAVINAVKSRPLATWQLLNVTGAPYNPFNPDTKTETVTGILDYNVMATNDAIIELGGNPFDNSNRVYRGSLNDWLLNRRVFRTSANPLAINEINSSYTTSGHLTRPLVTMHDIGDPIVPYWHENLYRTKVIAQGSAAMHANIPILRYGHCQFSAAEALFGFGVMVAKTTLVALQKDQVQSALPDPAAYDEYLQMEQQYGPTGEGHSLYLPSILQ